VSKTRKKRSLFAPFYMHRESLQNCKSQDSAGETNAVIRVGEGQQMA